ncbi:MAG TPA: patatin-like phospholipase family protein [Pseudonocardiaceae bacterium]
MRTGLVLAGGGVAGVAWELGVLLGIQDVDPELAAAVLAADVVVGTSAGSVVAAQLASGTSLADLNAKQLSPTSTTEIDVDVNLPDLVVKLGAAAQGATSRQEALRRIGAMALTTATVDEAARRAVIASRLPVHTWPNRVLLVTAVDAETGEPVVFTRESGVELVDAIAASCAVPGVWPTVTVNGRRLMDGGMRSPTNADLAAGCDKVLVLTPQPEDTPSPWNRLAEEIELLGPADVRVVHGDEASMAAFGDNPLSLATRGPAARAGRDVGRREAPSVAKFWH